MKNFLISLYQTIMAPIYNRLVRDTTLQLQDISIAYIEQHQRISTKMIDELMRLSIRLDQLEGVLLGRDSINLKKQPQGANIKLSEEKILEILGTTNTSLDVVEHCAKKDIPVSVFFDLQARYSGIDPNSINKIRILEQANFELSRLLVQLLHQQPSSLQIPTQSTADSINEYV